MQHLDHPPLSEWETRRKWFEDHIFYYEETGSYLVGEQACALLAEVECCFCAGAWAAVIIIALAVVETNLKETTPASGRTTAAELMKGHPFEPALTELRRRRNNLVHTAAGKSVLTVDQQWDDRAHLEIEARSAVKLMFKSFYLSPSA